MSETVCLTAKLCSFLVKYGTKWSSHLDILDLIDDEPSGGNWGQKKVQELVQGIIDCNSSLEYSL